MKYKASRYNWIVQMEEGTILYNSLLGSIMYIQECSDRYQFLKDCNRVLSEEECEERFLKMGLIVPYHVDEEFELVKRYKQEVSKDELFLIILPTEQCNFRCVYCYELFERTFLDEKSVKGIKEFVENNISRFSALKVSWFGGEPLMALNIVEELSHSFIQVCKSQKKPYYSSITTNGYLLDENIWSKLKECHILDLQLTIDGLEQTHDQQRVLCSGKGSWNTIINNLRYFRDYVKTNLIHIMVRTNITQQIYDIRNEYICFLQKEFGQDRRFHFFFHLAMDWGNIRDQRILKQFCSAEEYYEMLELASEKRLPMPIYRSFLRPFSRICFAAKTNAFVFTSEGAVRKCTQRLDDNENYIGRVESFSGVHDNNWDFAEKPMNEVCRNCRKEPLCMGMVCPLYRGNILDTCGTEFSDFERLLKIVAKYERISCF